MHKGYKSKQYKCKEWLRQQYETKSIRKIAFECGNGTSTIHRWLKKHGIEIHKRSRKTIRRKVKYPLLQDAKWLEQKYINEKLSTEQIAKAIGSSSGNVRCALQYAKIPIRSVSNGIIIHRRVKYPELWDTSWLLEQYEKCQSSILAIADMVGCHPKSVADALDRSGIKLRTMEQVQKILSSRDRSGKNAANWKGGRRLFKQRKGSNYIYIFIPDHPNATKEGYVFEHRLVMEDRLGRFLAKEELVHHKNGDSLDNRVENLEVVSKSQHVIIHFKAVKDVVVLKKEIERLKSILDKNKVKY